MQTPFRQKKSPAYAEHFYFAGVLAGLSQSRERPAFGSGWSLALTSETVTYREPEYPVL
ncbi:hypothetical protein TBC1_11106 [Lentimicrobium saccharophilum]|uniref:Uncharacterized protein n=1 Tax=Lentimicrobium saccharophilum TaxID=1678841 RepID=A0A0S7BNG7_9BACT|nr:hypothetical protein TBC1_11106 [Lentimicrobium saccharophilum]